MNGKLKIPINEIFVSIDGEVNKWGQGIFSTFIRVSGCNMKCKYCDTDHLGKELMEVSDVIMEVEKLGCRKITITGGEPLLYKEAVNQIINYFAHSNYFISLETNGSFNIPFHYSNLSIVADYKLPSSGEISDLEVYKFFSEKDYVKFVINNKVDYEAAINVYNEIREWNKKVNIAFSPVILDGKIIYDFFDDMIERKTYKDSRFFYNIQVHKLVGVK